MGYLSIFGVLVFMGKWCYLKRKVRFYNEILFFYVFFIVFCIDIGFFFIFILCCGIILNMIFKSIVDVFLSIILLFVKIWMFFGSCENNVGMIVMLSLILIEYVMINKFFCFLKLMLFNILILYVIIILNIVNIVLFSIDFGIIVVIVVILGMKLSVINILL